ncbi:MAG: hypothetical protein HY360_06420 [Verrucomicrobia bacterium]|nr:hypothetical protein [Verrucomicrobiota bacterium]
MDAQTNPTLHLTPHSRIAIVGGGPAGSFFALSAFQVSAQLGLPLDITIFERRDLRAAGPAGCNMCAGILSSRVVEGLTALGLALPPEIVMGQVRVYKLHWGANSIAILPPDPTQQVFTVYRGGGPRMSPYAPTTGFDAFLLDQARARGARIVRERVEEISLNASPRVYTSTREESFDLVVLATGVNAMPPIIHNHNYTLPATEVMAQDELLIESEANRAQMDGAVHIYFDDPSGLIFGALIPKRHFATVSLLGRRLARDNIRQFLAVPQVTRVVGDEPERMCSCRPRVAVASARGFCADRFVAVGDSCVTRLYKDGIGSALVTARAAAEAALQHGISRATFAAHYAPVCHAIVRDNRFGRAVFALIARSKRNDFFMRALARALNAESSEEPSARVVSRVLWSLFTGDTDYAAILRMMFAPRCLARFSRAMIQELLPTNERTL